jgi:DNA-binding NtrC family response regulator
MAGEPGDDERAPKGGGDQMLERSLKEYLAECEARYIQAALVAAGGHQRAAAELAEVPLDTFYKKVKRHGIRVEVTSVRVTRDAAGG